MAFYGNFAVNFAVFIFIISCALVPISASTDAGYTYLGDEASLDVDVSVTEYERYKRQASPGNPPNTSDTTTPAFANAKPPTTTPDINSFNIYHNDHRYYKSMMWKPQNLDDFWVTLVNRTGHTTLSNSHRTAVPANLSFSFPFYGHPITNVTIATGGFLYMSPFIHKFLTATQYIAPLMANFDTKSGGAKSTVLYKDIGKQFIVEWRDVHLQDQNAGKFRFQAILHHNGSIAFIYKQLPVPVKNISSTAHPVKIGLSDAFYYDTNLYARRRTIYEYHRVTLNTTGIQEGVVVLLNPVPTCNLYSDCESCINAQIDFNCKWCGIINRCSDSVDWFRQSWIDQGCVKYAYTTTEECYTTPTAPPSTPRSKNSSAGGNRPSAGGNRPSDGGNRPSKGCRSGQSNCSLIPTSQPLKKEQSGGEGTKIGIIVIVVVIVVVLLGSVAGWFYYAYSHPTSASGMWLMEHRPSQMKAKMNNMKFWKKGGSAGDKYAVESTA